VRLAGNVARKEGWENRAKFYSEKLKERDDLQYLVVDGRAASKGGITVWTVLKWRTARSRNLTLRTRVSVAQSRQWLYRGDTNCQRHTAFPTHNQLFCSQNYQQWRPQQLVQQCSLSPSPQYSWHCSHSSTATNTHKSLRHTAYCRSVAYWSVGVAQLSNGGGFVLMSVHGMGWDWARGLPQRTAVSVRCKMLHSKQTLLTIIFWKHSS